MVVYLGSSQKLALSLCPLKLRYRLEVKRQAHAAALRPLIPVYCTVPAREPQNGDLLCRSMDKPCELFRYPMDVIS